MIRVRIPGGSYPVIIEAGLLRHAGAALKKLNPRRICVITNDQVWSYWGAALEKGLAGMHAAVIRVPDGEQHKNLATVETIAEELVKARADRGALLVSLGGGVIGDIAGFVAAIYLRGVDYVHIPTTLLAQVDSAVGGKTGVNLRAGKNLIGSFHHPKMVLVDPQVLGTLPERELRAGLFEAIKCGVIRDKALFDFLEKKAGDVLSGNMPALTRVIHDCLALKARVVAADEKEHGVRRILNFGHTVGHALEAETAYRYFLHGEAVAWGMRAATRIAEDRGMIRGADAERVHALILRYGPVPPLVQLRPDDLAARLLTDKKTRQGVVHFVLPQKIGAVKVVPDVPTEAVERAIAGLSAS
jgi:3-dehydroquinate synthase